MERKRHSYKSANKNVIILFYLCSCVFLGRFGSNLRQSEDGFSVDFKINVISSGTTRTERSTFNNFLFGSRQTYKDVITLSQQHKTEKL